MKKFIPFKYLQKTFLFTFATLFFFCFTFYNANGQVTIWMENFEDNGNTANGGAGRYSSPNDFYDPATDDDYWGRVRGSDENYFLTSTTTGLIANSNTTYGGWNGNFYYAGEDLDDIGGSIGVPNGLDEKNITFSGINISGATNLVFKGLFARGQTGPCAASNYDNTDHIEVYYDIGAGEVLGMCFNADLECNIPGDMTNEPLYHDNAASDGGACSGDGGGGTLLTNSLAEFSFPIAGTGALIDLRVEVHMDAGSEEVAMDFFRLESDTPLPIELHAFKGKLMEEEEAVRLDWYTSSEANSDNFVVEHSSNGINFAKIGIIKAANHSLSAKSYAHYHENPVIGLNYYRIKQVDFDGSFDFSKVIIVEYKSDLLGFTVHPNPFSETLLLNLSSSNNLETPVQIFNLMGQSMYQTILEKNQLSKNLDVSQLEAGIYFLRIGNETNAKIQRIVKY